MGYIKAEDILPEELIEILQEYAEGQIIYIPKKQKRAGWGTVTGTRETLLYRNNQIFAEYQAGKKVPELAKKYYLSEKSIQRIIRIMKI